MKYFYRNVKTPFQQLTSRRSFMLVIFFAVFNLFAISPPIDIAAWGDSLTEGGGGTPYPTTLATLSGHNVFNGGVGGQTSTQIKARFDADPAKHPWSTIIWAGRNNFSNPTQVKADIAAMVASLGHNRYLVLSILNASDEHPNSSDNNKILDYNAIVQLNTDLAALYGVRYVDIRSHLVSLYNPTIPQDITDHTNDVPPSSMRSDHIHLNTAGYDAVAQKINNDHMNILIGAAAVPLKLISFTAKKSGSENLLQWTTGEEINSSHTDIERSIDGLSFSVIGKVANHSRGSTSNYSFADSRPFNGKNFYRLKFIDKDGKYEYSPIKTVNAISGFAVNVITNPVKENLTVRITSDKKADVTLVLVSSAGRELQRTNLKVLSGTETRNLNISGLSSGNYILRIIRDERETSSVKFLKL